MLDPSLCTRPISQWLALKSIISTWLMTPAYVVLPLVVLSILPWLIPKLRWKRRLSSLGLILLLFYYLSAFPLTVNLATKGLMALVPEDSGMAADAIVVLGRGEKFSYSRVKVAAQLWRDGRAPLIFTSGVGDAPEMEKLLEAESIPNQALSDESCSQTTAENALFTAAVLQPQGVKKIILVTDSPHMLRSLLTFRGLGFSVIPHSSPLPTHLATAKKAMIVFYEYVGLVSYGLRGNFFHHNT